MGIEVATQDIGNEAAAMTFGEWIRALRTQRGWSGEELARRADVARLTIIRLEKLTDPESVSDLTWSKIGSAFGWTSGEVKQAWTKAKDSADLPKEESLALALSSIPLLNSSEVVQINLVDDPQAFGYVIEGDLLAPTYQSGDIVILSPAVKVKDEDDAFVETTGGLRYFRKMFRQGPNVVLQTYKPGLPITLPSSQVKTTAGVLLLIRKA